MVFLVRHGQTPWSLAGRHTGRTDVPLTPVGEEQAVRAGEVLRGVLPTGPPPLVLVSPRQRARRTAELAGLDHTEVSEDLREIDYGDYEGRTTADIRRELPGWSIWTHPAPHGETAAQVTSRADRVLHRVRDALPHRDVVLVGHGHLSRVMIARWLGLPFSTAAHFSMLTGGAAVLGVDRGTPQLQALNLGSWGR
ncbi:acid phosphatase [Actinoalloteichus sp. AHMU CJ021]|uniref:histidine phosphatase family protein n=1 Tax=Actinoalloteichus TaxID=65496 RepID=UPI00047D961C|nr:histidine phosphatase family protein [Actinoalloteichus caeruleus]AUS81769.1 acid phosphatase [Actinoalloteichus sp. AHMU CJ021]